KDSFRFPGYNLGHFGKSDVASREKLPNGDIRFAALPDLGNEFIIFSGSMAKELARYRLDPNHERELLTSPFEKLTVKHPGTRWYNIASSEASRKYFPNNASRILGFFAAKIAENILAGKRTLLVCRRMYLKLCRK